MAGTAQFKNIYTLSIVIEYNLFTYRKSMIIHELQTLFLEMFFFHHYFIDIILIFYYF